jgi:hypothetical protein
MPLSTSPQSLDSKKGEFELALLISSLPINLVVAKPDLPVKQDEYEGPGCGEGEGGGEEVGRSGSVLKLTAAKKKTEWGPLISHCYSCYWRCILFTLKQLHSREKDSGLLFPNGNEKRTEKASGATNTEAITSERSKGNNYFSPSNSPSGPSPGGRCSPEHSKEQSNGERGALIPVASNDMNALIEACLSCGLDLADKEVPTVILCLQLLLPQVSRYGIVIVYVVCLYGWYVCK